ncbi:hypothetical protein CEXT_155791 [Caerostris extrusa]|uniref:Uncharacterized protein n=1 Tax=Caerostris extrusa TaxID=172846 RepID=A0AAV4MR05_CAEEX|nr:hypothetical protein CEXT_155791 [Caerostris extrusa]
MKSSVTEEKDYFNFDRNRKRFILFLASSASLKREAMRAWDLIKIETFPALVSLKRREEFYAGVGGRKVEWLLLLQQLLHKAKAIRGHRKTKYSTNYLYNSL